MTKSLKERYTLATANEYAAAQKKYTDHLIVRGSHGKFVVRMDNGLVVHYQHYVSEFSYENIVAVDVEELKSRHSNCTRCSVCTYRETDILGVGYWEMVDGVLRYEPPSEEWINN